MEKVEKASAPREWQDRAINHDLDNDTIQYGLEGPFDYWEGDHTGLVHVLWNLKHKDMDLKKGEDVDKMATLILHSRWLAAYVDTKIKEHDDAKD